MASATRGAAAAASSAYEDDRGKQIVGNADSFGQLFGGDGLTAAASSASSSSSSKARPARTKKAAAAAPARLLPARAKKAAAAAPAQPRPVRAKKAAAAAPAAAAADDDDDDEADDAAAAVQLAAVSMGALTIAARVTQFPAELALPGTAVAATGTLTVGESLVFASAARVELLRHPVAAFDDTSFGPAPLLFALPGNVRMLRAAEAELLHLVRFDAAATARAFDAAAYCVRSPPPASRGGKRKSAMSGEQRSPRAHPCTHPRARAHAPARAHAVESAAHEYVGRRVSGAKGDGVVVDAVADGAAASCVVRYTNGSFVRHLV